MGAGERRLRDSFREGGSGRELAGRLAGLASLVLNVALVIALVASVMAWRRESADLRGRVAEVTQQAASAQAVWKAQLAACSAPPPTEQVTRTGVDVSSDEAARRLLARGPEGVDVCARMESADQAVLSTLK